MTGNPELWTPARYVATPQRCHFCGAHIPRAAPGSRVGDRGSKAFYNSALKLFECLECRVEGTRADLESQRPRRPAIEGCESCEYRRLDCDTHQDAPLFGLLPCDGCSFGEGRGLHRTCPACGHVEHRAHVRHQEAA